MIEIPSITERQHRPCSSCVFECDIDGWNAHCNIELCTMGESIYYKRNYTVLNSERNSEKVNKKYPCKNHRTPGEMLKMLEMDCYHE